MKRSILAIVLTGVLALTGSLTAADLNNVYITKIEANNNFGLVLHLNQSFAGCSVQNRASVELNTDNRKGIYQAAMAAFMAGRKIRIFTSGCYNNQHRIHRLIVN